MFPGWWEYLRTYPWKNFALRILTEMFTVFGGLQALERYSAHVKVLNDWLASDDLGLSLVVAYFAVIRFFGYDVLVARQHAELSGDTKLSPPSSTKPEVQLPLGLPEPDPMRPIEPKPD